MQYSLPPRLVSDFASSICTCTMIDDDGVAAVFLVLVDAFFIAAVFLVLVDAFFFVAAAFVVFLACVATVMLDDEVSGRETLNDSDAPPT